MLNLLFLSRKDATAFRYYGDGTGRDSYMLQDYGGLVCNATASNKSINIFYKSLRSGSTNMSIEAKPGSMFHAAQNWLSPKAKRVVKECFNNQIELTRRLSTPKHGVRARAFD
jgi:hypothetical protein